MKKFSGLALLASIQVVVAIAAVVLVGVNVYLTRKVTAQTQAITMFQSNKAATDMLVGMSMEYSRVNPSIDPLLIRVGVKKPATSGIPASKPATVGTPVQKAGK